MGKSLSKKILYSKNEKKILKSAKMTIQLQACIETKKSNMACFCIVFQIKKKNNNNNNNSKNELKTALQLFYVLCSNDMKLIAHA